MRKINTSGKIMLGFLGFTILLASSFASLQQPPSVKTDLYDDGYTYRMPITNTSPLPQYSWVKLNYGYYALNLAGLPSNPAGKSAPILNDQKVAVLNGQRYIFANSGWGTMQTAGKITAYKANAYWEPTAELAKTTLTYSDFYVTTVPHLWNDTIILHGHTGSRTNRAFIGFYNISSNTFTMQDLSTVTDGHYITQVYYIESLNIFVLRELSLSNTAITDRLITSMPTNLFTPAKWVRTAITGGNLTTLHENMFAYNPSDGFGYLNRWTSDFGSELIKFNITTGIGTQIFYSPPVAPNALRPYITTNGTSIFFSSAYVSGSPSSGNTGFWRYWKYEGSTLANFANQSIVGYSTTYEGHGNIISISNDNLLCGSIRDKDTTSKWYLYQGNTALESYTGFSFHFSDNILIQDGANIVIGGESKTAAQVLLFSNGLCQKSQSDFDDVRFTQADGLTPLNYRLMAKTDSSFAIFAVDTSTVSNTFYVYFGKADAASGSNSAITPYLLYDTFNDSSSTHPLEKR